MEDQWMISKKWFSLKKQLKIEKKNWKKIFDIFSGILVSVIKHYEKHNIIITELYNL